MKQLVSFISYLEAFSALLLFSVAMPVKYIGGDPELVSLVGAIHGFLFVLFIISKCCFLFIHAFYSTYACFSLCL